MRTIKKVILFLIVLALLNGMLEFLLCAPSEVRLRVAGFKNGDENALILGHSLSRDGMDPRALSDENYKVYNMSFPVILQMFEPVLREMQQVRPIKKVYVEMAYPYYLEEEYNNHGGISYDKQFAGYMLKHDPMRALRLLADEKFTEILFPYDFNSWTVRSIPRMLKIKLGEGYRKADPAILTDVIKMQDVKYLGQGFVGRYTTNEVYDQVGAPFVEEKVVPAAREDFKSLVKFCKENDIEVVAFTCAVPPERLKTEHFDQVHSFYAELCEAENVPLYDLNMVKWEYLERDKEDYQDLNGHAMAEFATRQGQLLHDIEHSENPEQFFVESYQEILDGIAAGRAG